MSSVKRETLTLVLLGKAGSGKSIVRDTLVGNKEKTNCSKTMFEETIIEDEQSVWHIFKTQGIQDVEALENSYGFKAACLEMLELMNQINASELHGISVFLLVFNIHGRFRLEDKIITQAYEKIFGESEFWNRCIVVMTGGESFEGDFDEWVVEQTGAFQDLVNKCKNRLMLVSSKRSLKTDEASREKLVATIKNLKMTMPQSYSLNSFKVSEKSRKKATLLLDLPTIESVFKQRLREIERQFYDHRPYARKREFEMKFKALKSELKDIDCETGLLKDLMIHIDVAEQSMMEERDNRFICILL